MLEGIGRFAGTRHGFCVVCVCQGKDGNEDFFAFVAIEPHNYNYFRKTYKAGLAPNFRAYGHELLRGPGILPPEDVIAHVRGKYNVEFNVDRRFMERMIALAVYTPPASATESPFLSNSSDSPGKPAEALGS